MGADGDDFLTADESRVHLSVTAVCWVLERKKNQAMSFEGIVLRAPRPRLCRGTDLGKGTKTFLKH